MPLCRRQSVENPSFQVGVIAFAVADSMELKRLLN